MGDIGDYLKLALLRAVQPGKNLGVAWWLFEEKGHNGDGRHITYLSDPRKWRSIDPDLFDYLANVINSGQRHVGALQHPTLLSNAVYASNYIPRGDADRSVGLDSIRSNFEGVDVVFFDPDNGLEPSTYGPNRAGAGKSITIKELASFKRPERTLIVYHHQTRAKGGHLNEINTWVARLSDQFEGVSAVRCKAYSPRVYFLLNASDEILKRVSELCDRCGEHMVLNPQLQ